MQLQEIIQELHRDKEIRLESDDKVVVITQIYTSSIRGARYLYWHGEKGMQIGGVDTCTYDRLIAHLQELDLSQYTNQGTAS